LSLFAPDGFSISAPPAGVGVANVEENANGGTVIFDVEVTGATGSVVFSMTNTYLRIDDSTGVISVKPNVEIDYEAFPAGAKTFIAEFG